MVRMRSRELCCSKFQPRARLFSSTLRARAWLTCRCGSRMDGSSRSRARRSCSTRRWFISAAALRVKVMATTSSGCSAKASSASMRWVRSSVLPEPAGACTIHEWTGSRACSRLQKVSGSHGSVHRCGKAVEVHNSWRNRSSRLPPGRWRLHRPGTRASVHAGIRANFRS